MAKLYCGSFGTLGDRDGGLAAAAPAAGRVARGLEGALRRARATASRSLSRAVAADGACARCSGGDRAGDGEAKVIVELGGSAEASRPPIAGLRARGSLVRVDGDGRSTGCAIGEREASWGSHRRGGARAGARVRGSCASARPKNLAAGGWRRLGRRPRPRYVVHACGCRWPTRRAAALLRGSARSRAGGDRDLRADACRLRSTRSTSSVISAGRKRSLMDAEGALRSARRAEPGPLRRRLA